MRRFRVRLGRPRGLPVVLVGLFALLLAPSTARAASTWSWPVSGPVVEAFDPPDSPYGSGHRGIDIAAPAGSVVVAAEGGVVSFAGPVGGRLFLTIDHGGGLESRYSFLGGLLVRRNDAVLRGMPIALSATGHAGATVPHLHLGVLQDDVYQDPLAYLEPVSVTPFIRLAPLLV